jgi:hypothetical protein
MKTQIESSLIMSDNDKENTILLDEFNFFVDGCILCTNRSDLEMYFYTAGNIFKFKYGFGSNHFWVKQNRIEDTKRLLFIDFLRQ